MKINLQEKSHRHASPPARHTHQGGAIRLLGLLGAAILTLPSASAQVVSGGTKTTANHTRKVIGYVPQWDAWKDSTSGYSRAGLLNQLNLDYSQYSMLNFSFLGVARDGSLHSADLRNKQIYQVGVTQDPGQILMTDIYSSWDYWILYGEITPLWDVTPAAAAAGYAVDGAGWKNTTLGTSSPSFPIPFKAASGPKGLIDLCHDNGVKAIASIGGWSMCKHFPEMAADPVKRARFIADCQKLMAMGFDGIDIDWEYPGPFPGMNFTGSTADFANFTTMMTELRTAIGPNKVITAAFSASATKLAGIEWRKLDAVMDFFNIMSYDYQGGWSGKAGHNSPLFAYTGEDGGAASWHDTVNALVSNGVNLSKVNMGAAFYGRGVITSGMGAVNAATVKSYRDVQPDGPVQTAADFTNWSVAEGVPYHSLIQKSKTGWTESWDAEAKVPYLTKSGAFLSFDNKRSIGLKAKYIRDNGLGGMIVWTAFGDVEPGTVDSGSTKLPRSSTTKAPLINVVNEVLAGGAVSGETAANAFLSCGSASVKEGNSGTNSLIFRVSLSAAKTTEARVNFATSNGTATAGSDYTATSGTLIFAPGEVLKTITVPISTDTVIESNETFNLTLSNATGASLATTILVGGIADDDAPGGSVPVVPMPPTISISGTGVTEGNSGTKSLPVTVSLSATSTSNVTVNYATENGTATAGSDYVAASGQLVFAPGELSKIVNVQVNGDTTVEPDETFGVRLSTPVNATIGTALANASILNDDSVVVVPTAPAWTRHYQTQTGGGTTGGNFTASFVTPTGGAVWTGGFSGAITLTNTGSTAVSAWTVDFDAPWTTTGSGNAGAWTITSGHHRVTQPTWQGYSLGAGQSVVIDFTGNGTWSSPTNVTINGSGSGGTTNTNTTLASWKTAYSITNVTADADADTSASIGEFLLGTNPNNATSFSTLAVTVESIGGINRLVASFTVNPKAEGVEYRIESTTDTATWTQSTNVMSLLDTVTNTDGSLRVRWASAQTVASTTALSVRLMAREVGTSGNGSQGASIPVTGGGTTGTTIWTRHYSLGTGKFEVSSVTPTGSQVWGSGFSGLITLKNTGSNPLTQWTLQFDAPWTTTGSGNAGAWTIAAGKHTVTQPTWNGYSLPPGQTVSLDFTGSGTWSAPANITVDGAAPGAGATGNVTVAQFKSSWSISDTALDPDGDGLNSLLEFLLGTNPTVADTALLIGVNTRALTFGGTTANYQVISFEVEPKATGVEYTLESSANGTTWVENTGGYVLHTQVPQASGLLQVEWRSALPVTGTAPLVRIKAREVGTTTGGTTGGGTGTQGPTGAPNVPTVSIQKDWNDGIGHFIQWNTYGGQAVSSWKLFRNGSLVNSATITGTAPQTASFDVNSSAIGRFSYRVELTNTAGTSTSAETVYLTDYASPITIDGSDTASQISQLTLNGGANSITLSGGREPYTVTVNHPAAIAASVSGKTVTLTGTVGERSGLKIRDADGNVRLVGVRVKNTNGTVPGLPPYLGIGSVSEDSAADLDFWADYQPGTLKNKWVDYRYIYMNGGVKRKGLGWRTWTSVDGDRMRTFVRESIRRGMIPVIVWYNIPDGGESYTTDLEHIQDSEYMKGYYEDLKFAIQIANEEAGDETIAWLLEPDFIGYMAQNNRNPNTLVARTDAAYQTGVLNTASGDPLFPNTMRGLIESVNYTLKKLSNKSHIGWQFNLWAFPAGGWDASSQITGKGLIRITDTKGYTTGRDIINREGQLVADYYTSCGILAQGADYISIDKYGLDGGAEQQNADPSQSTWFWHAGHWANYLHYVKALNQRTGKKVMLWQLPVGHVNHSLKISPYTGEVFPDHPNVPRDWEDSGPSFFLGDRFTPGAGTRQTWFANNGAGNANVTTAGADIIWGSHMAAARDAGVNVMLFGDGVGNSTRARGAENTDEFWWISKVQEYYQNPVLLTP